MYALPAAPVPAPRRQLLVGTALACVAGTMLIGGMLAVWVLLRERVVSAGERFPVDYIINELSQGITLDAGSIIATGTPAGVGAKFEPHRCMRPGDVCEVEIEGCGILKNYVK